MIFVHEGSGTVRTQYGDLPFSYGDYIIVLPRGTIYRVEFKDDKNRLFIVESFSPFVFQNAEPIWSVDGTFAVLRAGYPAAPGSETYVMKAGDFLIKAKEKECSTVCTEPIPWM